MRRAILLFVKYPEPGRVKTRLAATVGAQRAMEIYRQLVAEVCRQLPGSGESVLVLFDPPERRAEVEQWMSRFVDGRSLQFMPQSTGDLGVRLECAFSDAFAAGFNQVVVIGSDCVEITPSIFTETWHRLTEYDLVLGPSSDGGYYLLALHEPAPALFRDIAWSTDAVLVQTLARAAESELRVSLLPELNDVDTEDDWQRAEARLKP